MIGMINLPSDSPAEYYTAPTRFFREFGEPMPSPSNLEVPSKPSKPSFLNLFARRKTSRQVGYLNDGRKVFDGKVVDTVSPPKLWEQLIVRTFVHKMEDEIQSPQVQLETIQNAFPKLTSQNKSLSASTYSLVSQDRLKSQCANCCGKSPLRKSNTISAKTEAKKDPKKKIYTNKQIPSLYIHEKLARTHHRGSSSSC
uniref:CRIB domain-containing protein n=1 Tax=Panagrellus redivivus TaxID=6233 RepID=A0A7E4VWZ7_PANRE